MKAVAQWEEPNVGMLTKDDARTPSGNVALYLEPDGFRVAVEMDGEWAATSPEMALQILAAQFCREFLVKGRDLVEDAVEGAVEGEGDGS